MIKKHLFLVLFLSFVCSSPIAVAQESTDRLAFSVGGYDILDQDDPATDFRVEWRFAAKVINLFHPFLGLEVTTDGAVYGLGGLLWDFKFDNNWFITPSLGAGIYKDGDGLDLGYGLQFRSQFEAGYEFENGHRLSGAYSHISNAGLGDRNPGTEVIGIYYSIPFNFY